MAILSKYRKNKKESRNSTMPQGAASQSAKLSSENIGPNSSSRQASNSTASSGAYDSMPMGTAPRTSMDKTGQQASANAAQGNGFSPKPFSNRSASPQHSPPNSNPQNNNNNNGSRSPQQGFRGPFSPTVMNQGPSPPGRMQAYPSTAMGAQKAQQQPQPSAPQQQPQPQSQFPWSQVAVQNASPFPRYGHAANAIAARDGEVFVMGGLKGSNVFGDLWVIESDTLTGYLLDTAGCPSPRVGHASLTLGNAYVVFGGDTKIEENDDLDDNLYLLNTTTLKWTVANPTGPRPSGRYGHSISTIGSTVYIFGGQLDDYFFDDLVCYDLATLRSTTSQWQLTQPVTESPPPRTNHTVITWDNKLYLFGGTDGKLWYSDTWCYDPKENRWDLLECSGFIPAPCEGHSATIVDDIMYVFGGRSSQGKDLGVLSALKLTTKKWFTFQNLGPGPSPRSGHSMTSFAGHKILVMGGESPGMPSTEDESEDKNHTVFVLDTSRINYPVETPRVDKDVEIGAAAEVEGEEEHKRSPSNLSELTPGVGYERVNVGDDDEAPEEKQEVAPPAVAAAAAATREISPDVSNIPGAWNGTDNDNYNDHVSSPPTLNTDTTQSSSSPTQSVTTPKETFESSPIFHDSANTTMNEEKFDQSTPRGGSPSLTEPLSEKKREVSEGDDTVDAELSPPSDTKEALERLKASNTWYESELAAAKDAGYVPQSRPPVDVLKYRRVSQRLTQDTTGSLKERDILIAALAELKEELSTVQTSVQKQAEMASERISAAERERDEALKTATTSTNSTRDMSGDSEKLSSEKLGLEKQLRSKTDELVLLQQEMAQLKEDHEQVAGKSRDLEETAQHKVDALAAAAAAVTAAEARAQESGAQLDAHRQARAELEDQVVELQRQVDEHKSRYDNASRSLDEHKSLLDQANEQNKHSSAAMSGGIEKIVALWGASKAFNHKSINNNDDNEEDEEEDPRFSHLQRRMDEVNELHKTHKEAADKASDELVAAMDEISALKQQIANSDLSNTGTQTQLTQALNDVESARAELEASKLEVEQLQHKHTELEEEIKTKETDSGDQVAHLQTLIEDARNEQDELEKQHAKQVSELEKDYEQSMQYYEDSQSMLTKTRQELNTTRQKNSELEEEVDELKRKKTDDDRVSSPGGPSSQPGGGKSSRQMELQLRDLRAQVMILQEERDDLRDKITQLKKKQINTQQDLQDAQMQVEELMQERHPGSTKQQNGDDFYDNHNDTSTSFADPESGQTLDSYNDELEKMQSERERIRLSH